MPVETIKCRECGSAEVTEFKPGSYVCGHCEAIFKHVTPADGAGGCQIGDCGVPAIGLCISCSRRFCRTHQAQHAMRAYLCGACLAQERERVQSEQPSAKQEYRRKLERIGDPLERLVAAVNGGYTLGEAPSGPYIRPADGVPSDVLQELCPQLSVDGWLWGGEVGSGRPTASWDSEALARWFSVCAARKGIKPDVTVSCGEARRTVLGRSKVIRVPDLAWAFPRGEFVFADGTLGHGSTNYVTRPSGNLSGVALMRMGKMLGLGVSPPLKLPLFYGKFSASG